MEVYQKNSHAVYDIKYHMVWVTKYRYKVIRGTMEVRIRELIRQGCEARGYFCATVGNVTEEMMGNYIANQFSEEKNDIFKIEDEF